MSRSKSELTKEKIIRAAAEVIRRDGLQACTHRSVAEEAGVSLGTTTYQFATLDALLSAVMQLAIEEFTEGTRHWLDLNNEGEAEVVLTRFVLWTLSERSRLNAEYELFVAAVSRPLLRPCAMNWLYVHEGAWLMRGILDEPDAVLNEALISRVFQAIVQETA